MITNSEFGFIPFASELSPMPLESWLSKYFNSLTQFGGVLYSSAEATLSKPLFYFVATGGTEELILRFHEERRKKFYSEPVFLIAHPGNNSLPAALEILARIIQEGASGKIFYLRNESDSRTFSEIQNAARNLSVYQNLSATRIGLIGQPSDWLIASSPSKEVIKKVWGPEVILIEIEELINSIKSISGAGIDSVMAEFVEKASIVIEPSKEEIQDAVKVYAALRNLISEYRLSSLSVRCFDLVVDLKTTGCFALSKLTDDGIIAGCEGDLVSALGMIWAKIMTGEKVWMANPARIDVETNSLWIAHCTVPVKMVEEFKLRSHFESGLGVGIQGRFQNGPVTLLRLGGKALNKIWIADGQIVETGNDESLCRTQAHIMLDQEKKVAELLTDPLGNHLILLFGKHSEELMNYWEMFIS